MNTRLAFLVLSWIYNAEHQQRTVNELREAGVFVQFSGFEDWNSTDCPFPRWMEKLAGKHYLYSIDGVVLMSEEQPGESIQLISTLPEVRILKLPKCNVRDKDIALLTRLRNIQWLELWDTSVTDACTTDIAEIQSLLVLDIRETEISDQSIPQIIKLRNLEHLIVRGSNLTPAGLEAIREALPDCMINTET